MMSILFRAMLRLFVAFLAAQLVLGLLGGATLQGLLGFSLSFVLLWYAFDVLDWYFDGAVRRALSPQNLGWRLARFLIGLNVVEPPRLEEKKKHEGGGQGS